MDANRGQLTKRTKSYAKQMEYPQKPLYLVFKMARQVEVYLNQTSGSAMLNVRIGFVLLFIDIFRQR